VELLLKGHFAPVYQAAQLGSDQAGKVLEDRYRCRRQATTKVVSEASIVQGLPDYRNEF
jgi:hypothetical protein